MKNFYECLINVINGKSKSLMDEHIMDEQFDKLYTKFMMHRYLSMNTKYNVIIQEEQPFLDSLDNATHYRYLFKRLPSGPRFIKYIKV